MSDQAGAADGAEQETDEGFVPSYSDYAPDELLEQAQANAQAALIATVSFLFERGIPLDDWAAALGHRFATSWDEPEPWAADEFLDAMLANYRSLGATVLSADLTSDRAEAVIAGFPDPARCAQFEADVAAVARFHDSTAPIAAARALRWSWTLEDPATAQTRLVVARDNAVTTDH